MRRLSKDVVYPYNLIKEILDYDGSDENITKDMADGLEHVLKNLDERNRRVIYLRYKNKYTYKKIAETLSIPQSRSRDTVLYSLRQLRHPSNIKYIRYGLDFLTRSEEEEKQRRERMAKTIWNNVKDVLIEDLDGVSVRTYLCLQNKGLNTIGDIVDFVNNNGVEWYRNIPNFGVRALNEVEGILRAYAENLLV